MKVPDLLVAGDRKKVNIKEEKLNFNFSSFFYVNKSCG